MKVVFLSIVIFAASGTSAQERQSPTVENLRLSVGTSHSCVIDDVGVKCWGKNDFGQTNVPSLKDPRQISAGDDHTCALDVSGVKCWGKNDKGQIEVPALKNPRWIQAGSGYTCSKDANGIICWGAKKSPSYNSKEYERIQFGAEFNCTLSQTGSLNCERSLDNLQIDEIFQFGVGERLICYIRNQTVNWGNRRYSTENDLECRRSTNFQSSKAPETKYGQYLYPLNDPTQMSLAGTNLCVISSTGLNCWAYIENFGFRELPSAPKLKNPFLVSAGLKHFCALDENGITCWGDNRFGQVDIPDNVVFFNFQTLKNNSPPAHYRYFENLNSLQSTLVKNSESEFLFYLLLKPSIEHTHSDFYQTVLGPLFQKKILDFKNATSLPEGINQISGSLDNRKIALKHIQAAFSVGTEFLSPADKSSLQAILPALGTAHSDPSDQNIKVVLGLLKDKNATLEQLRKSEQSAFVIDSIEFAANWLRVKMP